MAVHQMGREDFLLLLHLAESDADEWHRVASSWNWDQGTDVLSWIVVQEGCDRATAAMLFWLAQPGYYLQYPNRRALEDDAPFNLEGFDLIELILLRWSVGAYGRSEIAYDPTDELAYFDGEAAKVDPTRWPFQVPDGLRQTLVGRIVTADDYIEGYPPTLWAQIEAQDH